MNSNDSKLALDIIDGAHGLSERELQSYLDRVCGENSILRKEVLSYLDYDVEGTVLTGVAGEEIAPEIPGTRASETRYDLGDEIARGGMGIIVQGFDNNMRRDVAVKVLRSEWESQPEVVRRFLQEAQIGGQLQHPGIVPVYEIGQLSNGRPFIAMKLVKGKTLEQLLDQSPDPAEDQAMFLGIFEQVCQAVAFAPVRRDPSRSEAEQRDGRRVRRSSGHGLGHRQSVERGPARSSRDRRPEPDRRARA